MTVEYEKGIVKKDKNRYNTKENVFILRTIFACHSDSYSLLMLMAFRLALFSWFYISCLHFHLCSRQIKIAIIFMAQARISAARRRRDGTGKVAT